MSLILSLVLIMAIIMIYILMIQIFTVLFRITGLTKEKARFQVISLLTNSGFSTQESELIMTNKTRRKIAKFNMITGTIFNVLIVSLMINILFNITFTDKSDSLKLMGIAIICFVLLIIFIRLPFFRKNMEKLIENIATKINNKHHHENVITELDSYGNKSIVEVLVSVLPKELNGKTIEQANLRSRYNIIVLLVQRNGRVIDVRRDTIIQGNDKLVLFGSLSNIKDLFDIENDKKEIKDETYINNISIIDNYGSNAMVEVEIKRIPSILKNKTLGESILKERYDINIVMINTNDKIKPADALTRINLGDKVIMFGPYQHIKTLFDEKESESIWVNTL